MDSNFVHYDGRSVHDMIELLLQASGDPEAIARLLDAIEAVDAKFDPVNEELERLEIDKQDAGDYVNNGNAPGYATFKFSDGSYVMNMRRTQDKYSNGISIMGVNAEADLDGVLKEWFRWERNNNVLQGYIDDGQGWTEVSRWTADEDSGWQTMTGDYLDLYYRKKNGVLYLKCAQPLKQNLTAQVDLAYTLPEGFRPAGVTYIFFNTADSTKSIRFYITNTGIINLRPSETITQGTQIQGLYAIPL